jgi:branched-chain amino acid transport system ATP-binding protein
MLAIGRGLLANPKIMMLDEPSLGLSPRLTNEVFALIGELNRTRGLAILLVEQNTGRALELATRAYVLELGRKVMEGSPSQLRADPSLRDAYLGRPKAFSGEVDAGSPQKTRQTQ